MRGWYGDEGMGIEMRRYGENGIMKMYGDKEMHMGIRG